MDFEYLQAWGHYRTLVDLHERIHGRITDPVLNAAHLANAGNCHFSLRDYPQSTDLYTQALTLARDTGDRYTQGIALGNLGLCHRHLGDYRQASDLHTQAQTLARDIGDRKGEGIQLGNLGLCRISLGDYRGAIDLVTQALTLARDIGNRYLESIALAVLGFGHYCLGDNQQADDLLTQALAMARDIADRYGEAEMLDYLGLVRLASGDGHGAVTLFEQAMNIADATGDTEPAAAARSGLAWARLQLGDPAAALIATVRGLELPCPVEEPTLRVLEGAALLGLHRVEDSARAFGDALAVADTLLALADQNVAALQARALALSGLAVIDGDPARAAEAGEAFARARAVTSAAGVAADTRRLLDVIAAHDQSGVLTGLRAGQAG